MKDNWEQKLAYFLRKRLAKAGFEPDLAIADGGQHLYQLAGVTSEIWRSATFDGISTGFYLLLLAQDDDNTGLLPLADRLSACLTSMDDNPAGQLLIDVRELYRQPVLEGLKLDFVMRTVRISDL